VKACSYLLQVQSREGHQDHNQTDQEAQQCQLVLSFTLPVLLQCRLLANAASGLPFYELKLSVLKYR
jgi:hypothetical protein